MKLYIGAKAIIKNEGKVLVLREAKYHEGTNEGRWDVPGGRINPDEPVLFGLQREVREECGLEIEAGKVLGVFESFPVILNETCHIVRIYYSCSLVSHEIELGIDHDAYEWIDTTSTDIKDKDFVSDLSEVFKLV